MVQTSIPYSKGSQVLSPVSNMNKVEVKEIRRKIDLLTILLDGHSFTTSHILKNVCGGNMQEYFSCVSSLTQMGRTGYIDAINWVDVHTVVFKANVNSFLYLKLLRYELEEGTTLIKVQTVQTLMLVAGGLFGLATAIILGLQTNILCKQLKLQTQQGVGTQEANTLLQNQSHYQDSLLSRFAVQQDSLVVRLKNTENRLQKIELHK